MSTLEATVEIVKASLSNSTETATYPDTVTALIEKVYKKLKEVQGY